MGRQAIIGPIAAGSVLIGVTVVVIVIQRQSSPAPPQPTVVPQAPPQPQSTKEEQAAEAEGQKVLQRERTRKPTTPIHGVFQSDEATSQPK